MKRLVLLLFVAACSAEPTYEQVFAALPDSLRNTTGECRMDSRSELAHNALGFRYSWAVPTDEAIQTIASHSDRVVDFGAGSGYWSMLLDRAGVDVVAYDDWSWGKPSELWFPVEDGGIEQLYGTSNRALLLVYPPDESEMATQAIRAWGGDTLLFVGEPGRVTGSPSFLVELSKRWTLVEKVDLPNWDGKLDALYVLKRGRGSTQWMIDALAPCEGGSEAMSQFLRTAGK